MNYVYIIKSTKFPEKIYIGKTKDLKKRLYGHNTGGTFHTAKYRPWDLVIFFGILDDNRAINFEKYLKSGSGRAFLMKRFID